MSVKLPPSLFEQSLGWPLDPEELAGPTPCEFTPPDLLPDDSRLILLLVSPSRFSAGQHGIFQGFLSCGQLKFFDPRIERLKNRPTILAWCDFPPAEDWLMPARSASKPGARKPLKDSDA